MATCSRGRQMPILPENRHRYPGGSPQSKEWRAIVAKIRKRSKGLCEGSMIGYDCWARDGGDHPVTGSKVLLTVAHLDHTPENVDLRNLACLCQRCHNRYDAPHRQRTREARKRRLMTHEQGSLFESGPTEAIL